MSSEHINVNYLRDRHGVTHAVRTSNTFTIHSELQGDVYFPIGVTCKDGELVQASAEFIAEYVVHDCLIPIDGGYQFNLRDEKTATLLEIDLFTDKSSRFFRFCVGE